MKIEGTPKEIADLIGLLQGQPRIDFDKKYLSKFICATTDDVSQKDISNSK